MSKKIEKNCSWCMKFSSHSLECKNLLRKNIYHCDSCTQPTVECSECAESMARNYQEYSCTEKCFSCQGAVQDWKTVNETSFDVAEKFCSWCFVKSSHKLFHLKKGVYECRNCWKATRRCAKCPHAMTRSGIHEDCLKCTQLISGWESVEKSRQLMERRGVCSVCLEDSAHSLVERNSVRRDLFVCTICQSETMKCVKCKQNFTKKGPKSLKCIPCKISAKKSTSASLSWENLLTRKNQIYQKSITLDALHQDLIRPSKHKQTAIKQGLIRPFLILVSMHPAGRASVAACLGIDFITCNAFGDSHREAWLLIDKSRSGIRANATGPIGAILRSGATWYEILAGVNRKTFKLGGFLAKDEYLASLETENRYEILILTALAKQFHAKIHPENSPLVDSLMKSPSFTALFENIKISSIRQSDLLKRAIVEFSLCTELKNADLFNEDFSSKSSSKQENFINLKSLAKNQENVQYLSSSLIQSIQKRISQGSPFFKKKKILKTAAILSLNSFIIMPISPPLGVAILLGNIASSALKAHHATNFSPIAHILIHYLFLISQGIDISNYY